MGFRIAWHPGAVSILYPNGDVLALDLCGRPFAVFMDGRSYRRGLGGRILQIVRTITGRRGFEDVVGTEKVRLISRIFDRLTGSRINDLSSIDNGITKYKRFDRWLTERRLKSVTDLQRDALRYSEVYGRVGILPPDQYQSIVIQLTRGCAYNRCRFCRFYRGETYQVLDKRQLEEHIFSVSEYLGPALPVRNRIWLGEASVLGVEQDHLVGCVETVRNHLSGPARGGLAAFGDLIVSRKRSVKEYRDLCQAGLQRLYIGIESGCPEIRKALHKPLDDEMVLKTLNAMREGGISINPIFLLGAGGLAAEEQHVKGTADLLSRLEVRPGERVYLSPIVAGDDDGVELLGAGTRPLTPEQIDRQRSLLESLVPGEFRFATYDIRGFLY